MKTSSIEVLFRDWWEDLYEHPPGAHVVMTHVAFAEHLLQVLELLEVIDGAS